MQTVAYYFQQPRSRDSRGSMVLYFRRARQILGLLRHLQA